MRLIIHKPAVTLLILAFWVICILPAAGSEIGAAQSTESVKSAATSGAIGGPPIWQVLAGGGISNSASADYRHSGTIGQTAVFQVTSASNTIKSGFWMSAGDSGPCAGIPGDPNASDSYNILDPAYLINYLYRSGPAPEPLILYSGDPNCSCNINLLDVSYLINYLYKGGPQPCSCEDWIAGCGLPLR
ncbi:MAG: hypothetical protein AB1746_11705 [Candidatus Zixiibacteriota bacterium]